jgi:hypothetical protein
MFELAPALAGVIKQTYGWTLAESLIILAKARSFIINSKPPAKAGGNSRLYF